MKHHHSEKRTPGIPVKLTWLVLLWTVLFASGAVSSSVRAAAPAGEAAIALKKLQPAAGLKVELFAAEPLLENPVSISVDEKGRLFVAETHRYKDSIFDITQKPAWLLDDLSFRSPTDRAAFLRRTFETNFAFMTNSSELVRMLEDKDGDGRADYSSVVAEGFNESISGTAAGVLARHGSVWFANIPDLWRLQVNEQGKAIERKKLQGDFGVHIGVTGHDLHGLIIGPEGKLYFSIGDRGFKPPPNIHGPGFTTKFLERVLPDCGAVFRCNPDGTAFEVYCLGLRNPQELAFDALGNLFTVDNDTAGEDKSRLLYLVEGGDYGWRCSYQHMQGFGPWVKEQVWSGKIDDVLPWSGEVAQGPSGLAYNPGTALHERYKDHFFICDFPVGVWSFTVKQRGASYETAGREKFLWNLWGTDIAFGPDGAAYVSDWVEGWTQPNKGRIYKVSHPALATNALAGEVKQLLGQGLRSEPPERLAVLLGHPDMRIRQEAQAEIVNRALEAPRAYLGLFERVLGGTNRLPRLHALWGLRQYSSLKASKNGYEISLPDLLKDSDPEVRVQTAKAYPELQPSGNVPYGPLLEALKDPEPRVRFHAALSLGKIRGERLASADHQEKVSQAIDALILANNDGDAFLTHACVMALLGNADTEHLLQMGHAPERVLRRTALLCLRRLERAEIAGFLKDTDPGLVYEAARAINDVPIPEAMPALAESLNHSALRHSTNEFAEWALRRAVNARFRTGNLKDAQALADFAKDEKSPTAVRVEALDALSDWEKPQPLDRIMGLWRPVRPRDAQGAREALREILPVLLQQAPEVVQTSAIRSSAQLQVQEAGRQLARLSADAARPANLRKEALSALGLMQSTGLQSAVESALQSPVLLLRQEGIRWAGGLKGSAAMLGRMLNTETNLALAQTAFSTLSRSDQLEADDILKRWMGKLMAQKVPAGLELDILEACSGRPGLKQLAQDYEKARTSGDVAAAWHEVLQGGRSDEGKKIFFERADVQCLRCHTVRGKGGNLGPALDGLGKRQTREYIVESIVFPNNKIAAGFETTAITMKDGRTLAGQIKKETDSRLEVLCVEEGLLKLNKAEVTKREKGLSAMPEGLVAALTKRELRDLVEYLAELK
jgi:quinoprotein glucose dehydrogenase